MHTQRAKRIARVTLAVTDIYPPCEVKMFTVVENNPIRECDNPGLGGLLATVYQLGLTLTEIDV